jgi:DNA-binding winged helix-turn-helix (wHTH) protein
LVRNSGAVVRRRAQLSRLTWSPETLEQILLGRLQRVTDEATDLEAFYERRSLLSWLHRAGGESPRDWLMLFASVLRRAFQIQGQEDQLRPLTDDEWEEIRCQYPVHLDYDPKAGTVKVNWRVVRLSPAEEILFSYLFEHRGEVCSLRDLYRAYERQTNPDTQLDELKAEYRGRIDTLVYRLRQAIEPDPWHPLLLVTHKGRGYCLR